MACDTFIKIAQKCRRHFVQVQVGEVMPFIEEILNGINTIICDLQPQQVHTFYEAVGLMIGAQTEQQAQEHLIERYMLLPNQVSSYYGGAIATSQYKYSSDSFRTIHVFCYFVVYFDGGMGCNR